MNRTNGNIAKQSKEKLANALLNIMNQYDFKEITVTQITQEAELSRKTFYRLFTDKEEVLMYYFEGICNQCLEQIKKKQIHHYWELVQMYFDFWETRKEMLELLKKNHLLSKLSDYAYQNSLQAFECVRSADEVNTYKLPLPYLLAYSVGGMHSMLFKWIENDMDVPSGELINKLKTGFMSDNI